MTFSSLEFSVTQWLEHLHTCQLSLFSQDSPSFSSNLPFFWLEHLISWEILGVAFFIIFSLIFSLFFEMSERKIKQEVDLVLFFQLFLIRKHKNNQIDICLTSIVIGQISTNHIAQYMVENWHSFGVLLLTSGTFGRPAGDFRRVFRHC